MSDHVNQADLARHVADAIAAAREQGRREGLEQAALFLERPFMVFAFEREHIREDVIRRIRALAQQAPEEP